MATLELGLLARHAIRAPLLEIRKVKSYHIALTVAGVAALVSAPWIVPKATQSVSLLMQSDDVAAIVDYQLDMVPPENFQNTIEQALADDDPELAASLVEVATDLKISVPADLVQRVTDAQGFDAGRMAGEVWDGFFKGDASSGAALNGSLAADFIGFGDARDLVLEGSSYLTNGTYDPVVLGISAVGLTLTVATVVTAGGAAPARAGTTVLKAAKKAGQLPAPLVRELGEVAVKAIDGPALEQAIIAAKRLDISGAGAAASRILNPAATKKITQLADDVANIVTQSGYRAVNQTLQTATSIDDIGKLRRLAAATGTKFRGALKVLAPAGGLMMSLGGFMMALGGWAISGLVWLLVAGFAVSGFAYRVFAWVYKRRRNKDSAPASAA